MTDREQQVDAGSELDRIVAQADCEFDEPESLRLVARLREIGFIDDANWDRILEWLELESAVQPAAPVEPGEVLCVDADPRNEAWIKIAGAERCAGCRLPSWAAMWLWRIGGHREDPEFWEVVRREVKALGIAERDD